MNVQVRIHFESPGEEQLASMTSLAQALTHRPESVHVFADEAPGWLVAEFTMPTEPQYAAVETIDRAIRFWADDRTDSTICFPRTAEEQARAARKAERRRARRRKP